MTPVRKSKLKKPGSESVQMHFVVGDPNFPNGVNYHTHGLATLYGHPDLQICLPIQPHTAKGIFNAAINRIAKGDKLLPDQEHAGIIRGFDVKAIQAQEWGRVIIRLVLPDENGKFDAPYYQAQVTKLHSDPDLKAGINQQIIPNVMQQTHQNGRKTDFVMLNLEVRKVPSTWLHPRDEQGKYIPMHESYYLDELDNWWKQHQLWEKKRHPAQKNNPSLIDQCQFYADYAGDPPNAQHYQRIKYPPSQMKSYQVYETVTEGTPVSPVLKHIKSVRIWLEKAWGQPHLDAVKFCRAELERLGQDPQQVLDDSSQHQQPLADLKERAQGKKPAMDPLDAAIHGALDDTAAIDRPLGGKKGRLSLKPKGKKR